MWAQGRAVSIWLASRINVASSPKRPRTCTPIGRPSAVQVIGTDMAGLPARLATTAEWATVWPPRCAARYGSSGVEVIHPIGAGGADMVGVKNTSYVVRKPATVRENRWIVSRPAGSRRHGCRARPASTPRSAARGRAVAVPSHDPGPIGDDPGGDRIEHHPDGVPDLGVETGQFRLVISWPRPDRRAAAVSAAA